ncbi:hypothetical protein SAMN05444162_1108 [Paenibacillaceae bacterium GAS479]|nr:hypothetical protein SAMN05444162_1108 [Paenibacillaceae bacterium GAS479]
MTADNRSGVLAGRHLLSPTPLPGEFEFVLDCVAPSRSSLVTRRALLLLILACYLYIFSRSCDVLQVSADGFFMRAGLRHSVRSGIIATKKQPAVSIKRRQAVARAVPLSLAPLQRSAPLTTAAERNTNCSNKLCDRNGAIRTALIRCCACIQAPTLRSGILLHGNGSSDPLPGELQQSFGCVAPPRSSLLAP